MLRVLIYGLAILHLGPGIAFVLLTVAAWVLMLLGLAAMYAARRARYSRG
jgi:hypothetical protein